jgi:hypothetical protein
VIFNAKGEQRKASLVTGEMQNEIFAADSQWDMFTVTDCLLALHRAHSQLNAELGTLSLRHFVDQIRNGRRLVSVDDQSRQVPMPT